jgi:hypothetical protein
VLAVLQKRGPIAARQLYTELLRCPQKNGDLYKVAVDMELALVAGSNAEACSKKQILHLFEVRSATHFLQDGELRSKNCTTFVNEIFTITSLLSLLQAATDAVGNADEELWLKYALFEKAHVGKVYWKAAKHLEKRLGGMSHARLALAST